MPSTNIILKLEILLMSKAVLHVNILEYWVECYSPTCLFTLQRKIFLRLAQTLHILPFLYLELQINRISRNQDNVWKHFLFKACKEEEACEVEMKCIQLARLQKHVHLILLAWQTTCHSSNIKLRLWCLGVNKFLGSVQEWWTTLLMDSFVAVGRCSSYYGAALIKPRDG